MENNGKRKVDKSVYTYALVKAAVVIVIPLLVYFGMSLYLSFRVYNLVESAFQSKGRDYETYEDCIGRINYEQLDYSRGNDENWRVNRHSFPIVWHNFKTAKAEYQYTIEGNSIGGKDIPVTVYLEKRDGKWYITRVDEPY